MPRKYSEDFRWRIVFQHCLQGKPIRDVAKDNHIGHSTVERLVCLYKGTGEVRSIQEKHGPEHKLSEQEEFIVLQLFLDSPGIYLREVQLELHDITGSWVDCSTICRTAQRLGLTRQKMKQVAIRRSDILQAQYMVEMEAFNPHTLVFVDETGCERRNSIRWYGYGLRGITPVQHQITVGGKRISAIGVLTTRGMGRCILSGGCCEWRDFSPLYSEMSTKHCPAI